MKYQARGFTKPARKQRLQYAAVLMVMAILVFAGSLWLFRDRGEGVQESDRITASGLRVGGCGSGQKKHQELEHSSVAQLRKLAEYEGACNEAVVSSMSIFVNVPTTLPEATAQAKTDAAALKEFARFSLMPTVFLEPRLADGTLLNLTAYHSGGYDAALEAYFGGIKAQGVSDAQMGMWVPQPEGNTTAWGSSNPQVYAAIVARTVTIQKKYFPGSKASILLDSKTTNPISKSAGYTSFLPYVQSIPPRVIDAVGLQGFPSSSAGRSISAMLDPRAYLGANPAIEAARSLGAGEVWFNTGTFRHFAKTGFEPMELSPEQRQGMLDGVIEQAFAVRAAGLQTALHLFAKDKSAAAEKVDWSYWASGQVKQSSATPVFKTFVHDARKADIPIWLYDY